jgi:hypothetical protein
LLRPQNLFIKLLGSLLQNPFIGSSSYKIG